MKYLYKFFWDLGRQGCLEGLFTAQEEDLARANGCRLYFGEVLGKHSEIEGTLDVEKDVTLVSKGAEAVSIVEALGLCTGFNPLDYVQWRCDCGCEMDARECSTPGKVVDGAWVDNPEPCMDCAGLYGWQS